MNRPVRVYVIGPYTRGDPCVNTHRAWLLCDRLIERGFVALCPHLTHFAHTLKPRPYRFWMDYDAQLLDLCDCALWDSAAIPGESSGGQEEVCRAGRNGQRVFYAEADLVAVYPEAVIDRPRQPNTPKDSHAS